jgi:hypothetical protein
MRSIVLSNEMSDVSRRKERINAENAEYTEGTERKRRLIERITLGATTGCLFNEENVCIFDKDIA